MPPVSPILTLRDYLVPLRRRWWLVAGLTLIVTAVVTIYYARRPATFTATTQVYIGPQSDSALGVGSSEPTAQAIANQATLLTSTEVAAVVAKRIGYRGSAAVLASSVTATPSTTTSFLHLNATEPTAAFAVRVVNGFAQEFIRRNSAAQIGLVNAQISTLRKQLRALPRSSSQAQSIQSQIQQLQVTNSSVVGSATQVDVAQSASESRKSPVKYGVLAALAALIGSILLAYALERLDPRFKSVEDASDVYGQAVLATVTHDPEIEHFVDGKPRLSPRSKEAFRELRVALDLAAREHPFKAILVTSAVPDEGKSTVARNLALAITESDRRVVLVDADLRRPRLAKTLGVSPHAGISEILRGTRTLADTMMLVDVSGSSTEASALAQGIGGAAVGPWALQSLAFLPAGSSVPNPPAALGLPEFAALLEELKQAFDVVVIDSTPLVAVPDAIPIAQNVDAVVLVARSTTDRRSARRASELIQRVPGANIAGLVVNDVPAGQAAAYGYGYGYQYGHEYRRSAAGESVESAAVSDSQLS